MNRNPIPCRLSVAFVALLHLLASLVSSRAEVTHELVASFKYVPHSLNRESLTLGPDGDLWATAAPSMGRVGSVFKIQEDAANWLPIGSLPDISVNPPSSQGSKLVSDGKGNLWGVSFDGATYGKGSVFKVNMETGVSRTVATFGLPGDDHSGASPHGELVNDGRGFMWGSTTKGGIFNQGTVYRVSISSCQSATMAEFSKNGFYNKGAEPFGGLVSDGKGFLWGTTSLGGSTNSGTIFKINISSGNLATVLSFTKNGARNKGANPYGTLMRDGSGMFWGTTYNGGAKNYGTVFKLNPSTGVLTTVIEFTHTGAKNRGAKPRAGLVRDGQGYFWGTTEFGGSSSRGTLFKINASTGVLTTMAEFKGKLPGSQGANPATTLVSDGKGNLWGTTKKGGVADLGTIFQVNTSTGKLRTLLELRYEPVEPSGLESDGQNYLWGTTRLGGAKNLGTLFKVNPSTREKVTVVEFSGNGTANKGAEPIADLWNSGDGFLWGATSLGGAGNHGTLFKVNIATSELTTVVEFTNNEAANRGALPLGKLISDGNGILWGTTLRGGVNDGGTVFKLNLTTGELTTVVDFTSEEGSNVGIFPQSGLVSDGNGFIWGTTLFSGFSPVGGTIYKVNVITGAFTVVEYATQARLYELLPTPLLDDGNGFLWGVAIDSWKGVGYGEVYKVDRLSGLVTSVVKLSNSDGVPIRRTYESGLVSDGKGFFWGTTSYGGSFGFGILYKVNAATGALTKELDFSGYGSQANSGSEPGPGNLILHSDGYLYGTTLYGGPGGGGTIYRFQP